MEFVSMRAVQDFRCGLKLSHGPMLYWCSAPRELDLEVCCDGVGDREKVTGEPEDEISSQIVLEQISCRWLLDEDAM